MQPRIEPIRVRVSDLLVTGAIHYNTRLIRTAIRSEFGRICNFALVLFKFAQCCLIEDHLAGRGDCDNAQGKVGFLFLELLDLRNEGAADKAGADDCNVHWAVKKNAIGRMSITKNTLMMHDCARII